MNKAQSFMQEPVYSQHDRQNYAGIAIISLNQSEAEEGAAG